MNDEGKRICTESRISDLVVGNINRKQDDDHNFTFVDMIDNNIVLGKPVEFKTTDFDEETQKVFADNDKGKVALAIRDAVERVFKLRFGLKVLEDARKDGMIKITLDGVLIEDTAEDATYKQYLKSIPNENDVSTPARWLVMYWIKRDRIISCVNLDIRLEDWAKALKLDFPKSRRTTTLDYVFSRPEMHQIISKTAFEMGRTNDEILFEKMQYSEIASYIMGKYYVKQFGLAGELIFFNGRYYEPKALEITKRECNRIVLKANQNTVREVVGAIDRKCELVELEDAENQMYIKCLKNGLYDIKKGEFTKGFSPDYLVMSQIDYDFDEEATFKEIDRVTSEIINDDKQKQVYYDFLSLMLHPFNNVGFILGIITPAGFGKSSLGKLPSLLFKGNVSNASMHDIARDRTTRLDIAMKMANIDEELSTSDMPSIGALKKIAFQEDFTDRAIYGHNQTYRPAYRLMFLGNELFEIARDAEQEAMNDRVHFIDSLKTRFRHTGMEIKNVYQTVLTEEEGNGFITYLLKNATKIWKEGKVNNLMKPEEVNAFWNKFGNRIREFSMVRMKRSVGARILRSETWEVWQEYASMKNIEIGSRNKFYEKFQEINGVEPQRERTDDGNVDIYYLGIRALTEDEIKQKEQQKLRTVDDT